MALYETLVRRGLRAGQPAASAVEVGTLYFVTDELVTERSTGSAWESYGGVSGGASPADASYVTLATNATLTNERVLTGSGRVSVTDAGAGSTVTLDVPDGGITYAKIQDVSAASRIIGRGSAAGSGDAEELSLGTGLSMSGTTLSASSGTATKAIGITIDGAGSTITTGVKGFVYVPYACTITAVTLLSTDASVTSGSIVVDVWKDTYANYPPTDADAITAAAVPTISAATKGQDTSLSGWTTSISAGDILGFNVDSVTSLTRVTVILTVTT